MNDFFRYINLKIIFIALSGLLFVLPAKSQIVRLNLGLKKDTIMIGKRTELFLDIRKDKDVVLSSFPLKDSLVNEIEILDSVRTSGPDSLQLRLQISSFTPGNYIIPPIPLVFAFNSLADTLYSQSLLLTVVSPQIDSLAEIKDIKPPLNLPFKLKEILPETVIIIGILVIIAVIIFMIIRQLRKKKITEIKEMELPAHIIALRELDKLKKEKAWQKDNLKEYYSRLSDIIRIYLENRFGIPAMEYVSSETIASFRKAILPGELLPGMLEGILQTADMVKFAKGDPLPSENLENLDNAYMIIEKTKIEEADSDGEDDNSKEEVLVDNKIVEK